MEKEKINHINNAIVSKTNPRMYLVHKYWARKPANVVRKYIENYSNVGDIVFDPFCGSGITIGESLRLGRKSIGIDLSSLAIFISEGIINPVDLEYFKKLFEEIRNDIRDDINDLYSTDCFKCGRKIIAKGCIREGPGLEFPILSSIWYECEKCKLTLRHKPTKKDQLKLQEIEKKDIELWYPDYKFPKGGIFEQARREAGETYDRLFTKRNLLALAKIFNRIEKIKDCREKELLKLAFSSCLIQVSKLIPINLGREKAGIVPAATWSVQSFWCPPRFFEGNVFFYFETRFEKIKSAKEESNKILGKDVKRAKLFENLIEKNCNYMLLNQSSIDISSEQIPSNSIDYVFTDPPYGEAIHYLELSAFFHVWLTRDSDSPNFELPFSDEIIIRKNNYEYYQKQLTAAFREVYRVLKPGKWLTVTFHSVKVKIFSTIIRAIVFSGFKLDKIIYQPAAKKSVAGLERPYGSAHGDYYIRFFKPKYTETIGEQKRLTEAQFENIVVETTKKILAQRGQPTYYTNLINSIYVELDKNNALLHLGEQEVEEILRKFKNKVFITIEEFDKEKKKKGVKWWFKNPDTVPYIEKIPLNDRVEKAILSVLERNIKVDFTEVQQEILLNFPNALTPDNQEIIEILDEYAEKTTDKKWRLKNLFSIREREHDKIIYFIAWIGTMLGFGVYSGHPNSIYNEHKVSDLRNYIFMKEKLGDIDYKKLKRLKEIDVIWIGKDNIIHSVFEVENTTGITESLIRVSNIPYGTNNYIVIPEEREKLLLRKLKEPLFEKYFIKGNWNVIYYCKLEDLFEDSQRKDHLKCSIIDDIVGIKGRELDPHGQNKLL